MILLTPAILSRRDCNVEIILIMYDIKRPTKIGIWKDTEKSLKKQDDEQNEKFSKKS